MTAKRILVVDRNGFAFDYEINFKNDYSGITRKLAANPAVRYATYTVDHVMHVVTSEAL